MATGVAPLAVPRSPGLSLRPCRSCVPFSYPSQASFDGGAHSDGICMTVSISAAKIHASGSVWLGLCDRPIGLGGAAGDGSEKCGSCVCGSVRLVVRWWLAESRLCSCRAINSSGSELYRSCDQLSFAGVISQRTGVVESASHPPEGGVLPSRPGAGPADRT